MFATLPTLRLLYSRETSFEYLMCGAVFFIVIIIEALSFGVRTLFYFNGEDPVDYVYSLLLQNTVLSMDNAKVWAIQIALMWNVWTALCLATFSVIVLRALKYLVKKVVDRVVLYWRVFGTLDTLIEPPSDWRKVIATASNLMKQPAGILTYKDRNGMTRHMLPLVLEGGLLRPVFAEDTPGVLKQMFQLPVDLKESHNPSRKMSRYFPGETRLPFGYMFSRDGSPVGAFTRQGHYLVTTRHTMRGYEDGEGGPIRICKFDQDGIIDIDSARAELSAKFLANPACKKNQHAEDLIYYEVPGRVWDKIGVPKGELAKEIGNDMPVLVPHAEFVTVEGLATMQLYKSACEVVEGHSHGTRYHNGDTGKGDCGFPLLVRDGGSKWKIAGIHKQGSSTAHPNIRNGFTPAVFMKFIAVTLEELFSSEGEKESYDSGWGHDDEDKYDQYEVYDKDDDYWESSEIDAEFGLWNRKGKRARRRVKNADEDGRRLMIYRIDRFTGKDQLVPDNRKKREEVAFEDIAPEVLAQRFAKMKKDLEPFRTSSWADFESLDKAMDGIIDRAVVDPLKEGPKQLETSPSVEWLMRRQLGERKLPVDEVKTTTVDSIIEAKREIQVSFGKTINIVDEDGAAWKNMFEYVQSRLVHTIYVIDGLRSMSEGVEALDHLEMGVVSDGHILTEFQVPWDDSWSDDIPEEKLAAWKQILWSILFHWELYLREIMDNGGNPITLEDFITREFTSFVDGQCRVSPKVVAELAQFVGSIVVNNKNHRDFYDQVFMGHDRYYFSPERKALRTMKAGDFIGYPNNGDLIRSSLKEGPRKKTKVDVDQVRDVKRGRKEKKLEASKPLNAIFPVPEEQEVAVEITGTDWDQVESYVAIVCGEMKKDLKNQLKESLAEITKQLKVIQPVEVPEETNSLGETQEIARRSASEKKKAYKERKKARRAAESLEKELSDSRKRVKDIEDELAARLAKSIEPDPNALPKS